MAERRPRLVATPKVAALQERPKAAETKRRLRPKDRCETVLQRWQTVNTSWIPFRAHLLLNLAVKRSANSQEKRTAKREPGVNSPKF